MRWAFLGGTALRFLYNIPRFSEDLDFSAVVAGTVGGFTDAMKSVKHTFETEGYVIDIRLRTGTPIASAFVKFPGLPHEMGFSRRTTQTLSIKVEVDTNPPDGAESETTIVRRHVILNLYHHDKASLLAGKLHAILARPWTKGRDLFDLAWYLADRTWPEPNLVLLNNALAQTNWQGVAVTADNWRNLVVERLATLDWTAAQADVRPFLEHERDQQFVTREALAQLLQG